MISLQIPEEPKNIHLERGKHRHANCKQKLNTQ